MKRNFILLAAALSIGSITASFGQSIAPSILNTAGGYGTIAGSDYEYSIGEMALVSTFTTTDLTVTQGVLQPMFGSLGISKTVSENDGLQVYPNPSSDIVNIRYEAENDGVMEYRLMDITGKILQGNSAGVKKGTNTQTLNISEYAAGNYMLEVVCTINHIAGQTVTYKIQKLN